VRQERSYVQPSCVLQVWWERESYINDRYALQQLTFILRLTDQQLIRGDLAKLWALMHSIDSYVQKFLSQDYLPSMEHQIMGLKLTSGQLVDVSNAIEELRGEVILLPLAPSIDRGWLKSVLVGLVALGFGTTIGLWLASRQSRPSPVLVVAPPPPQEVFTDLPPPSDPPAKEVQPESPVIQPKPKQTLPPIRVYPPPTETPPPPAVASSRALTNESLEDGAGIATTIENVEISTSEALTQDLINYLRSVPLPPGKTTIDVTVELGKVESSTIENSNPEVTSALAELLKDWKPVESSGRVRLEISSPDPLVDKLP
jgi:hypothetical protein